MAFADRAPDAAAAAGEAKDGVVTSAPPSHILEDGRFVYLPPPNVAERSRFFERSIARHNLLQADMEGEIMNEMEGDETSKTKKDDDEDVAPKIHPLATASARLQLNGLAELNRAINLDQLVGTGSYFGLTTIVDPSLELETPSTAKSKEEAQRTATLELEDRKTKASFVLKRKFAQLERATTTLGRHAKQLKASVAAQSIVDKRLFELRQQWRLVAPEHGTRARLHAARPTEVVAIDVDVYDQDRVGGGNRAAIDSNSKAGTRPSLAGRLASRVPRFATIELHDLLTAYPPKPNQQLTRAEPFAVADPTLGRVMEQFDPNDVPMLTLQLDIEKASTGFRKSACLSPISTVSAAQDQTITYEVDEQLLISLQHSLFCASLFESIRNELDEKPKGLSKSDANTKVANWLSYESEENFLPAPSSLAGGDFSRGLAPLCVAHCYEGEVKVQLDMEYSICVKLVEASSVDPSPPADGSSSSNSNSFQSSDASGSESPARLHVLCRALLLHAQDVYHSHSLNLRAHAKKMAKREVEKANQLGLARVQEGDELDHPRILQSCVSLGSKMLFERRVRRSIARVRKWLDEMMPNVQRQDRLIVEWLPTSFFDPQSQFTVRFRELVLLDVSIVRDGMTVTQIRNDDHQCKVKFHSEAEFELFLKLELKRASNVIKIRYGVL